MSSVWIILTGALIASSCAFLGCFLILRRMAMLGDAISHSILPGIVIAFLVSGSRDPLPMFIGAAVFGLLCTIIIQLLRNQGVQADAAMSVSFTALFAIGIILISLFTQQVDLDLDCVLYGEIAYVPYDTWTWNGIDMGPRAMWGAGAAFLLSLIMVRLFYKQFKLTSFDPALAMAVGVPVAFFHYLLMGLVSVTTVASFESVGAILVVAMLIVPAATAYLLTERLGVMLGLSVLIGMICSVCGYFLSVLLDASIAGCMTMVAGGLFALAFLFSPHQGVVTRWWIRKKLRTQF
ncbi:manganese/zinc/iron transport system permease protein [Croceifilum oryzae]|uniref:Manganese/zinc/iron transport system permease protein n=1 Tax=Croceifilum oryzae TaxID=1553429 RepID=A0AAJ1TJ81_9BACL|nr:metal ABC transporter permease [Croceifilum oryzae]MDQ0417527.1 manganese/zinc/iron transport system permease protein [Croceifilum oryzae]